MPISAAAPKKLISKDYGPFRFTVLNLVGLQQSWGSTVLLAAVVISAAALWSNLVENNLESLIQQGLEICGQEECGSLRYVVLQQSWQSTALSAAVPISAAALCSNLVENNPESLLQKGLEICGLKE